MNPDHADLFQTPIGGGGVTQFLRAQYDVAADGRFLINSPADEETSAITLLQNWSPEPGK
jgi:hypothetical protein